MRTELIYNARGKQRELMKGEVSFEDTMTNCAGQTGDAPHTKGHHFQHNIAFQATSSNLSKLGIYIYMFA